MKFKMNKYKDLYKKNGLILSKVDDYRMDCRRSRRENRSRAFDLRREKELVIKTEVSSPEKKVKRVKKRMDQMKKENAAIPLMPFIVGVYKHKVHSPPFLHQPVHSPKPKKKCHQNRVPLQSFAPRNYKFNPPKGLKINMLTPKAEEKSEKNLKKKDFTNLENIKKALYTDTKKSVEKESKESPEEVLMFGRKYLKTFNPLKKSTQNLFEETQQSKKNDPTGEQLNYEIGRVDGEKMIALQAVSSSSSISGKLTSEDGSIYQFLESNTTKTTMPNIEKDQTNTSNFANLQSTCSIKQKLETRFDYLVVTSTPSSYKSISTKSPEKNRLTQKVTSDHDNSPVMNLSKISYRTSNSSNSENTASSDTLIETVIEKTHLCKECDILPETQLSNFHKIHLDRNNLTSESEKSPFKSVTLRRKVKVIRDIEIDTAALANKKTIQESGGQASKTADCLSPMQSEISYNSLNCKEDLQPEIGTLNNKIIKDIEKGSVDEELSEERQANSRLNKTDEKGISILQEPEKIDSMRKILNKISGVDGEEIVPLLETCISPTSNSTEASLADLQSEAGINNEIDAKTSPSKSVEAHLNNSNKSLDKNEVNYSDKNLEGKELTGNDAANSSYSRLPKEPREPCKDKKNLSISLQTETNNSTKELLNEEIGGVNEEKMMPLSEICISPSINTDAQLLNGDLPSETGADKVEKNNVDISLGNNEIEDVNKNSEDEELSEEDASNSSNSGLETAPLKFDKDISISLQSEKTNSPEEHLIGISEQNEEEIVPLLEMNTPPTTTGTEISFEDLQSEDGVNNEIDAKTSPSKSVEAHLNNSNKSLDNKEVNCIDKNLESKELTGNDTANNSYSRLPKESTEPCKDKKNVSISLQTETTNSTKDHLNDEIGGVNEDKMMPLSEICISLSTNTDAQLLNGDVPSETGADKVEKNNVDISLGNNEVEDVDKNSGDEELSEEDVTNRSNSGLHTEPLKFDKDISISSQLEKMNPSEEYLNKTSELDEEKIVPLLEMNMPPKTGTEASLEDLQSEDGVNNKTDAITSPSKSVEAHLNNSDKSLDNKEVNCIDKNLEGKELTGNDGINSLYNRLPTEPYKDENDFSTSLEIEENNPTENRLNDETDRVNEEVPVPKIQISSSFVELQEVINLEDSESEEETSVISKILNTTYDIPKNEKKCTTPIKTEIMENRSDEKVAITDSRLSTVKNQPIPIISLIDSPEIKANNPLELKITEDCKSPIIIPKHPKFANNFSNDKENPVEVDLESSNEEDYKVFIKRVLATHAPSYSFSPKLEQPRIAITPIENIQKPPNSPCESPVMSPIRTLSLRRREVHMTPSPKKITRKKTPAIHILPSETPVLNNFSKENMPFTYVVASPLRTLSLRNRDISVSPSPQKRTPKHGKGGNQRI